MDELQRRELAHREREIVWDGGRRSRYEVRVELEAVLRRLRLRPGDRVLPDDLVLDAGCGAGRLSRLLLARGAQVVAVDFSLARLQHLQGRVETANRARLRLAACDLTRLPLAPASCNAIVCTQVIEHLPTPAARRELVRTFHRLLRPGGTLLLTAYHLSEPWRRRGQPREGIHDTGIFYHCYTADELAAELEGLERLEICGIVHLLPRTYRLLPLLGPLGRKLDHLAERYSSARPWANLLLAHARRG